MHPEQNLDLFILTLTDVAHWDLLYDIVVLLVHLQPWPDITGTLGVDRRVVMLGRSGNMYVVHTWHRQRCVEAHAMAATLQHMRSDSNTSVLGHDNFPRYSFRPDLNTYTCLSTKADSKLFAVYFVTPYPADNIAVSSQRFQLHLPQSPRQLCICPSRERLHWKALIIMLISMVLCNLLIRSLLATCALLEKRPVDEAIPLGKLGANTSSCSPSACFGNASVCMSSSLVRDWAQENTVCIPSKLATRVFADCLPCFKYRAYWYCSTTSFYPVWISLDLRITNGQSTEIYPSISPSIYVVIESFTASDECHLTGTSYDTFTATFVPEAISTFGPGGIPNAFNFSDMPCGPNGMTYPQGGHYEPYLVAPAGLMDQMGLPEGCALN